MRKILAVILGIMVFGTVLVPGTTLAADPICRQLTNEDARQAAGCVDTTAEREVGGIANKVIDALLYAVGIIAVVMIIFGGVQMATSAGDAGKVTKAKNTILAAVIGLVIAVLAYAIVHFVLGKLT